MAPFRGTAVLLLKTKSASGDRYEEVFLQASEEGWPFKPYFIPVLEHRLDEQGLIHLRSILTSRMIGKHVGAIYGGLIFTSQRAVEAFTKAIQDSPGGKIDPDTVVVACPTWSHLREIPIYSVGPATTRSLKAIPPQEPPLQVFGGHTGNGDDLARFILEHYRDWYRERAEEKPALLFLVGEQRRDIIPKTLMDEKLPGNRKIKVEELAVYGTGVMESFLHDFGTCLQEISGISMTWIVVFSPTGCDAVLRRLGMIDEATGRTKPQDADRTVFVATIGPTTRDYLRKEFNFEPDVCSEKPTPEGVLEGIRRFVSQM